MKLFVHRAGRTARAGRDGRSVSLVGPRDAARLQMLCIWRRSLTGRSTRASSRRRRGPGAAREAVKADAERHAARDRAGRDWARRRPTPRTSCSTTTRPLVRRAGLRSGTSTR